MLAPELGVVGEEVAEGFFNLAGVGSEGADLVALQELDVSFFLARDDVVDEHGAFGGDGFVHGCATGFADDEMVGGKEFGDLAGPAFDFHAAGELVFDFAGFFIKAADVASEDDGDFGVVLEDGANNIADVG